MPIYCAAFIPLVLYGAAIAALAAALFGKNRQKGLSGNLYDNDWNNIADGSLPGVSIIIPFRNEEENLPALLESLKAQNYRGMIEVVFVNDRSEDNGAGVIKTYLNHSDSDSNNSGVNNNKERFRDKNNGINTVAGNLKCNNAISVKIIDLQLSYDINLTSKQQALDLGVSESSCPLLLFTDADMVLAPEWAASLVRAHLASGAGLVFGHTSISQNGNFRRLFTMFEAYQLEFLFAFAYAFSRLNLTGSCMGNNLLIVREAYIKCGGQRGAGYSIVEDRALLELLRKRGFRTAAAEPFHVTAETRPSRTWKQFFRQTARWARGGLRPGSGLFWAGLLLLIQNIAVFAVFFPIIWGVAAINFLLTWAFLTLAFGKTRSPAPRLLYPAYYLFMMAETVIFAFSLAFGRKIEWKGRDLSASGSVKGNNSYQHTGIRGENAGGLK